MGIEVFHKLDPLLFIIALKLHEACILGMLCPLDGFSTHQCELPLLFLINIPYSEINLLVCYWVDICIAETPSSVFWMLWHLDFAVPEALSGQGKSWR